MLILYISVALASLLFPMEAKVAMEIAQVEGTSEFTLESVYSQNLANAQRTVDLNDAPFMIKEEHLARLRALSKTGKCASFYCYMCVFLQVFAAYCKTSKILMHLVRHTFNKKILDLSLNKSK